MPEPDLRALLRRLEMAADSETAHLALAILAKIEDELPLGDPAADRVRETLAWTRGVALLRVSDARPSSDPLVPARGAAQYALAMLFMHDGIVDRDRAIELFAVAADRVFAQVSPTFASVVGVIYYIRYRGHPEIKIGYATSLKPRLAQLATGSAFDIEVLASHPGTVADEAALHGRFAHLRVTPAREWFREGADLIAHISEVKS
jgi:hypothetical protein